MAWVVIFERHKHGRDDGYGEMAALMEAKAMASPGYLHHFSLSNDQGHGVTLSYWSSLEDIKAWKRDMDHQVAQKRGQSDWYSDYAVQVAQIAYAYQTSGFSSYAELFKKEEKN